MRILHDLFVGNYPISQIFGVNYDTYKWITDINGKSILGHNGIDWATPEGVILLNPFPKSKEVVVSKVGYDPKGYGNYVRLWNRTDQNVILYAHCKEVNVVEEQSVKFQQKVAITDNTGWSTGNHVHVGYYEVDDKGNKLSRSNGFDGFLNILSGVVAWEILNPQVPSHDENSDLTYVEGDVYSHLVNGATVRKEVAEYLEISDPDHAQTDSFKAVIGGIKSRITDIQNQLVSLQSELENRKEQVGRLKDQLLKEQELQGDLMKELNNAINSIPGIQKVYEDRITVMQGQIDNMGKEKGELNDKLRKCETNNEINNLTVINILILFFEKLFKKIEN